MFENEIMAEIVNYSIEQSKKKEFIYYTKQIDWVLLFEKLVDNRLLLYGYNLLKAYIPEEHKCLFAERIAQYKKTIDFQINFIKNFTREAKKCQIDCFFIKGIVLSMMTYNNVYIRDPGDIDVMVREYDLNIAKEIMNRLGYYKTYFVNGSCECRQVKEPSSNKMGVFHELVFSSQVDQQIIYAEIKVYTSAIRKIYVNEFWNNRQIIMIEDTNVSTNNAVYTFIHLCSNVYGNTERRFNVEDKKFKLRDYIDLISFIKKYREVINWETVEKISDRMQIKHKIKNTLINIKRFKDEFIEDDVIKCFNSKKTPSEILYENDGSVVDWKSNLLSRMLNREATVLEYRKLYMNRLLSNKNQFFSKPYELGDRFQNDYQTVSTSEDAGVPISYKFWQEQTFFYVSIIMNKKELQYFIKNKVYIEFHFFCCEEAFEDIRKDIHKILKLDYRNDSFLVNCCGSQLITCLENKDEFNRYIIEFHVDKKNIFGSHRLVPYNIFIFETEIEDTIPILAGVRFSEEGDEEETTDMEVLKL